MTQKGKRYNLKDMPSWNSTWAGAARKVDKDNYRRLLIIQYNTIIIII